MSIHKNQSGFSPVEVVLLVVVVALLGLGLYTVYNRQQAANTAAVTVPAKDKTAAPEIKTTEDLDKAEQALDANEVENANDSSQLDNQLSAF